MLLILIKLTIYKNYKINKIFVIVVQIHLINNLNVLKLMKVIAKIKRFSQIYYLVHHSLLKIYIFAMRKLRFKKESILIYNLIN
jgi:hypothetical protein